MKKTVLMGFVFLTLVSGGAFAHDKKAMMKMTPEQRQNMAMMHEKMAACLRTDKPIGDCKTEMRKSCKEMGAMACPMMKHAGHETMPE